MIELITNYCSARPAPPETVFPLYHDLVEQAETRRQIVRDLRKQQINKNVKPFSFDARDREAAREKARRIREARDEEDRLVKATSSTFRAMELDRSVLENVIDWDTAEEERKKRIRERSEKTLRASSAGRQVTSRKEPTDTQCHVQRRIKTHKVPNFAEIHKKEAKKMEETKQLAEEQRSKRPKSAAPSKQSNKLKLPFFENRIKNFPGQHSCDAFSFCFNRFMPGQYLLQN